MKNTLILLAAVPLVACSTVAEDAARPAGESEEVVMDNTEPSGPREYTDEERAFLERVNFCKEDGLEAYLGQTATAALATRLEQLSGSKMHRILAPLEPATQDYRTDRLNIMTNDKGVIIRLSCG